MPNWTYNRVGFLGEAKDEKKLREELKKILDNGKGLMEHYIPMPETYKKYDTTNHESKFMKVGEEFWECDFETEKATNKITVTQEFLDKWKAIEKEQQEKYGAVGWYDWRLKYWGCKWDVTKDDVTFIGDHDIEFETPWSAPDAFIQELSKKYPKLDFFLTSEYDDNSREEFEFMNGKVLVKEYFEGANDKEEGR